MTTPPPPGGGSHPQQPFGTPAGDHAQHGGHTGHPGGPSGHAAPQGFGSPTSDSDKTMAILAHLSGIIATVLSVGWLPFLGPLLVWLVYKDRDRFVRQAAAASFNFHLGFTLVWIGVWVIGVILSIITLGLLVPVLLLLVLVLGVLYLWWTIRACMAASEGRAYDYPFQLPVLN